ncbi:hypothetical protein [Metarhizobium album]|uniref:hypothetical protein n=1 Tax=Metarhizobium album TaxID=2182425 RepID=UPI0019812850|nr:hypothetical protein [Rhizobium album]
MTSYSSRNANHRPLSVTIGDYPQTRRLKQAMVASQTQSFDFIDVKPISRAFAPMVRKLAYDISEMAIVTYFLARAAGVPIVLLPVALAARYQEEALLCRANDRSINGPESLAGKRVGVRAYSQTTAVWIRGILGDEFGLQTEDLQWSVAEGSHVEGIEDPAHVRRIPDGGNLVDLLLDGELDAVILGNDVPSDTRLRTVFPDTGAAARKFHTRHGFKPVNHVLVAKRSIANDETETVLSFVAGLQESADAIAATTGVVLPCGRDELDPPLDLVLRYSREQGLVPHSMVLDDLWEASPGELLRMRTTQ